MYICESDHLKLLAGINVAFVCVNDYLNANF